MEEAQKVKQSVLRKYKREIRNRIIGGIEDYQLVLPGDQIAVCISDGKDPTLLTKCLQVLQRHTEIPFELEFLSMDPGYDEYNRQLITQNAEKLEAPLTVFSSRIFEIVNHSGGNPCYLRARMRRGYLCAKTRGLGCNKIALAHHFGDVIKTTMISMLYGAEIRTMMPRLPDTNFPGMEIIHPLYLVRKHDVLAWKRYDSLEFVRCGCPLSENASVCTERESNGSKRAMVKELIARLYKDNPQVDVSISRSMRNVNLDTIPGYRQGD